MYLSFSIFFFVFWQIVVVDANGQLTCFVYGQGPTRLAIRLQDGHYNTITSMPGFLGTFYFYSRCLKGYDHQGHPHYAKQEMCNEYIEAYDHKRQ